MCNLSHIEILSRKIKPLLIFCSEARLTNEICEEIKLDEYNEIICTSKNRFTGGVVMYVKEESKYKIIYNNSVDKFFWCIAVEMLNSNVNGIFSCFYRANNK